VRIAVVNYAYDAAVADPEALVDRYETLAGWAEAVLEAGAGVMVAQRFSRDAEFDRRGVRYVFRRDEGPATARWGTRPAALHAAVAAAGPDVVHVNGLLFPRQLMLLRAALGPSPRIVVQDHAGSAPPGRRWGSVAAVVRRARLRRGFAVPDGFLFTAREQARPWQQAGLLAPTARVFEVPESSTTLAPLPREAARDASGVTGHPALLWVGRLVANKDPLTVLDGVERAAALLPDLRLTVVFQRDDLLAAVRRRLGQSAQLAARVRLVGEVPRSRLAAYYSAADLFVSGSHAEGSGYALLEALACGAVPVVTDIPPFRALARAVGALEGLWTPGDAWMLARAIVACGRLDFGTVRRTIRERFEAELSWRAVGRRALGIYARLLREAPPAP
jgi:glycosyltransferase involved in cell wall biosynthesis